MTGQIPKYGRFFRRVQLDYSPTLANRKYVYRADDRFYTRADKTSKVWHIYGPDGEYGKPQPSLTEAMWYIRNRTRYARMPLPPQNIPPHVVPMWKTRATMLAIDYRNTRDLFRKATGSQLTDVLNALRLQVDSLASPARYRSLVMYRSALNEAVVSRHWTVTWSALTNEHEIR